MYKYARTPFYGATFGGKAQLCGNHVKCQVKEAHRE